MRDNDTKILEEAYEETMKQESKRKFHYIDKGRKGYYCKLCVHFQKNVKSPQGDEFFCNALKIYVNSNGLCTAYKTSRKVRNQQTLSNFKPDTPDGAPADNRSPALRGGGGMHSDPVVSQTPV